MATFFSYASAYSVSDRVGNTDAAASSALAAGTILVLGCTTLAWDSCSPLPARRSAFPMDCINAMPSPSPIWIISCAVAPSPMCIVDRACPSDCVMVSTTRGSTAPIVWYPPGLDNAPGLSRPPPPSELVGDVFWDPKPLRRRFNGLAGGVGTTWPAAIFPRWMRPPSHVIGSPSGVKSCNVPWTTGARPIMNPPAAPGTSSLTIGDPTCEAHG